jgi:Caspase domain
MHRMAALLVSLACLLTGASAGAETQKDKAASFKREQEKNACHSGTIAVCTRLIQSGKLRGDDLAEVYAIRGDKYRSTKQYDQALADADQTVRLGWADQGHGLKGMIHFEKGNCEQAVRDFGTAIEGYGRRQLAPDFLVNMTWEYHAFRGRCHEALGALEKALDDYRTAVKSEYAKALPLERQIELVEARLAERGAGKIATEPSTSVEPAAPAISVAPARPASPATAATVAPPPAPLLPPVAALPQPSAPAARMPAEKRVALVIGNFEYAAVGRLPNPRGDADAVAASLRRTGFRTVTLETDLSRDKLVRALRAFQDEAETADWAMIYYAGHGIEVGGVNYLVPIDARLKDDRDVQDEAVPLDRILSAIEGAKKLRLVVLDACRDNPFVAQMRRSVATRSIGRGLARIEPEGGTLVAYAAKHGQVALDGDGANSPFVAALVKHLQTPGLELNKLFRLVRDDVMAATGRKQEPFVYGSLPGEDFFFVQR